MVSPGKNFTSLIFLTFIVITGNLHAKAKGYHDTRGIYQSTGEKIFIINTYSRDLNEFRKLVNYAAKLKPYGKVQINISTLADNSFYELPKQRSPWFQYACNNATPYKFFPDPKIAPF